LDREIAILFVEMISRISKKKIKVLEVGADTGIKTLRILKSCHESLSKIVCTESYKNFAMIGELNKQINHDSVLDTSLIDSRCLESILVPTILRTLLS
jgi:phospholipid N-methyltransferase